MARNGDGGGPGGAAAATVGDDVEDGGLQLGATAMIWHGQRPSDGRHVWRGLGAVRRKTTWEWGGGRGGKTLREAEVPCSLSCQVEDRLPGEVGDVGEDMVGGWEILIRRCG